MVVIADLSTLKQFELQLARLLSLQNAGGFTEPLNGVFVAFTPAQLTTLQNRINTVLANLQVFIAALTPV